MVTENSIGKHFPRAFGTLICLCSLLSSGCDTEEHAAADYVVTIAPLKMILDPLVDGRKTVACLVPPGVSPHTFSLRPSGARQLSAATALFYTDDALDGWAAELATGPRHAVFDLVTPERRIPVTSGHHHGTEMTAGGEEFNAHFWSDPQLVKAIIPALVGILVEADPEGQRYYEANAAKFVTELEELDRSIASDLAHLSPVSLVAFHPSWSYFFRRYGIEVAAYVEPIPGKELTPQTIIGLRRQLEGAPRAVILSEVQLPRKSADALAEALNGTVGVLDPLGGRAPLESYGALLRFNTAQLRELLQ